VVPRDRGWDARAVSQGIRVPRAEPADLSLLPAVEAAADEVFVPLGITATGWSWPGAWMARTDLQSGTVAVPLRDVIAALDARYDPALAEAWDAVGLVCGDPDEPVRRVLFAVDPTSAVVDEVIATGADLLVTHHPLLLTPVHGVPADEPKGRLVHRLIRAGAALFVAHTNADRAPDSGVNSALAAVLGLRDAVPLEPTTADPRAGLGRVGDVEPMTLRQFAAHAATVLPATVGGVRVAGDPEREVRRVAVCGGSGGSLLAAAAAVGADVLLTSDLKHHPASDAGEVPGPALCDVAHFASEWPWLPVAAETLAGDLSGRVEVAVSRLRTDPWTYRAGQDTHASEEPAARR
jgi:dinuclear metal center YbgI/SA1388 family protein